MVLSRRRLARSELFSYGQRRNLSLWLLGTYASYTMPSLSQDLNRSKVDMIDSFPQRRELFVDF